VFKDLKAMITDMKQNHEKEGKKLNLTKLKVNSLKSELEKRENMFEIEKQDIKRKTDEEKANINHKYNALLKQIKGSNTEVRKQTWEKVDGLLEMFGCVKS